MSGDDDGGIVSLTADQVARLAAGVEAPDQPSALFRTIDEVARDAIGHALFTAMVFDEAAMTVERIYSSDENAYPLGGRKPKRDTAWGRHVLLERHVYVGEGDAAIREAFADHELILSLDLRAVVNIPVVFASKCLGTLNFLWRRPDVRSHQIEFSRCLALIATAAFTAPHKPVQ